MESSHRSEGFLRPKEPRRKTPTEAGVLLLPTTESITCVFILGNPPPHKFRTLAALGRVDANCYHLTATLAVGAMEVGLIQYWTCCRCRATSSSMEEEWKLVPGIECLEVSNLGRARTLDDPALLNRELRPAQLGRGRLLHPHMGNNGYLRIDFKRRGKIHRVNVHRLVALTFVEGFFEGATIEHIDGNRINNNADNLRWVSMAQSAALQRRAGGGVLKGVPQPGAKLQHADIPKLFELRASGLSYAKIGRRFGVSSSMIHKITSGSLS